MPDLSNTLFVIPFQYDNFAITFLDIRLLRAFAVVAEENNISRAAQRLFISQPPLTRHIRHLEAQLGVTLFQRHSKGLILTDAGREVLEMIQPLLALGNARWRH